MKSKTLCFLCVFSLLLAAPFRLSADNKLDSAVALVRSAAKREAALPFAFGPPSIPKPPHELLGDLLLKHDNPKEAGDAFTSSLARAAPYAVFAGFDASANCARRQGRGGKN